MTSLRFEPDGQWSNYLAELIDRAWWLLAKHGRQSIHTTHYQGRSTIIQQHKKGVFCIYYCDSPRSIKKVYYMTADGGPGLCQDEDGWQARTIKVIEGMRHDMVLDDLAMI